jgi:uncharacterized membrane protein YfcA
MALSPNRDAAPRSCDLAGFGPLSRGGPPVVCRILKRRATFARHVTRPCGNALAGGIMLGFDRGKHRLPRQADLAPTPVAAVITDPLFYLLAVLAVTLLGLSKGGFFGLGVMGIPLMSLYVPPMQAAAIILPTALAQDVLTVWTYRRDWSAWNLRLMIPSMAAGMGIATLFAASLSAAHVRLAIGLIAALFVLRHWLGRLFDRMTMPASAVTGVVFGGIGGFTTLLANAGGPPWQMHLLPQNLDKLTYVGTVTMLFAVSNVIKIPAFGSLGQLTADNLLIGAALLPAAVVANYAGIWLVRRTPAEAFYRIAYVLMFVIAIELIRGALAELLTG